MGYTRVMRDSESGFTLIETMIAVVVIAILAALALPSFFRESGKVKAASEVQPMFNDLRIRLEEYMQEHGVYPATIGETAMYPSVQPPPAWDLKTNALPATWIAIKVLISGTDQLLCRYTWVTGLAGAIANAGLMATTAAPAGFGFTAPSTDWYYLLAKCNMDGDPATFSWYFTSSVDASLKKLNEGQ